MSSGPENRFIRSINSKLPSTVYAEKMHNPYRGGTFDCWYSGKKGDVWVEYKWVPAIPKKGVVPNLSPLQQKWGRDRFNEGRHVLVIVGHPGGGVIFSRPDLWEEVTSADAFRAQTLSKPGIVNFLTLTTTGDVSVGNTKTKQRSKKQRVRVQNTGDSATDL